MPNTPLNPDALVERIAGIIDSECQSYDAAVRGSDEILYGETTDLPRCAAEKIMALIRPHLAVAQPVVNKVDYLATPRGHYDAWTDTGDGYTQRKGWTLTCLWCGAEFTGATKGEALKGYEAHEEKILQVLRVEDAERAKNRPEVPGA